MDFYYPKIANYFCVHIHILVFLNFKIPSKTAINNLNDKSNKTKIFPMYSKPIF